MCAKSDGPAVLAEPPKEVMKRYADVWASDTAAQTEQRAEPRQAPDSIPPRDA